MFHLGWFMIYGFGIQPWRGAFAGRNAQEWMKPEYYRDMTTALESGGFDYILVEDTAMIDDSYGSSMETSLRYGWHAPKNDPVPLIPLMVQGSRNIGIVSTVSTMQHHPYIAARQFATLDHLTDGRVGANIVTSVTHRAAHNIGLENLPPHDERYKMAEEWVDCAIQLWESWEADAVVADPVAPTYVDHNKVHPIEFRGKYFSSRGPLSTAPGPQRRPVLAQAGTSPAGRDLAARFADTMIAQATTVQEMRDFRDDMHARVRRFGRRPEEIKLLYLVSPILGEDDAHALNRQRERDEYEKSDEHIKWVLWNLSYMSGGEVDYAAFDLDAPLPEVLGNGQHSTTKILLRSKDGKTLRELAASTRRFPDLGLVGGPDTVAAKMGELMTEVGGDGFLVLPMEMNRRSVAEYTDGLSPALRRRGLIRDGYSHKTFRDNLLDF